MFELWYNTMRQKHPLLWLSFNKFLIEVPLYHMVAVVLLIMEVFTIFTLPRSSFDDVIEILPSVLAIGALLVPMWLNIPIAYYNLHFKEHNWWSNTAIGAYDVANDQGLFGEYMATVDAELNLKRHNIYGKVFNNVIVPKSDGDYNEIDVLIVCEAGVFVIESKARRGIFKGQKTGDTWTQTMGNDENVLQNPFMQNLGHCNYLTEYLYHKLPPAMANNIDYRNTLINTVLFTLPCNLSKISSSPNISPSYFGFTSNVFFRDSFLKYDLIKDFGRSLSREQVDAIAEALTPISSYSREQREFMSNQRKIRQDCGAFSHPFRYYIAEGMWYHNAAQSGRMICRDNGYYRTYMDMQTGLFYAHPAFQVVKEVYRSRNLSDVINEYYRGR